MICVLCVMDEDKMPRPICFVVLTKQQCFFSEETECLLLSFLFLFSVYVVLALIVLIQAADRRDPERDGPSHSTLHSLFYFSHVVGRGNWGECSLSQPNQDPLLFVTHTYTKDLHLFSSVSTISFFFQCCVCQRKAPRLIDGHRVNWNSWSKPNWKYPSQFIKSFVLIYEPLA